jgi:predicted alpha/beta-hydrolase family hydrolase
MVEISSSTSVGGNILREVSFTIVQPASEPGHSVCFMCPGSGYSFDKPLLYFSTMLMLAKGIDVVQIKYRYKDDEAFWVLSDHEQSDRMYADVKGVVEKVLGERQYRDVLFLGKSIGTMPIVNGLFLDPRFAEAKAVLMTPVLNRANLADNLLASSQQTLLIMGNNDRFYDAGTIQTIQAEKPNVELLLMDGANHAMDIGWDVQGSIDVLKTVMVRIDRFVSVDYNNGESPLRK